MIRRKSKEISLVKLIGMLILLILIIVLIVKIAQSDDNEELGTTGKTGSSIGSEMQAMQDEQQIIEENQYEEFVTILEDGSKLNISPKLNEDKRVEDLEITNITLTYKDGVTNFLAIVKNINNKKIEETPIEIQLLDENANTIYNWAGIIGEVEEGKNSKINSSITANLANAYDAKIIKK